MTPRCKHWNTIVVRGYDHSNIYFKDISLHESILCFLESLQAYFGLVFVDCVVTPGECDYAVGQNVSFVVVRALNTLVLCNNIDIVFFTSDCICLPVFWPRVKQTELVVFYCNSFLDHIFFCAFSLLRYFLNFIRIHFGF